jgi:hypothetical protein
MDPCPAVVFGLKTHLMHDYARKCTIQRPAQSNRVTNTRFAVRPFCWQHLQPWAFKRRLPVAKITAQIERTIEIERFA